MGFMYVDYLDVNGDPVPANYADPADAAADIAAGTPQLIALNINTDLYDNIEIGKDGIITGIDLATDDIVVIGQIATATFINPAGLTKVGNNMYAVSTNSGPVRINTPAEGSHGELDAGVLEMSNVDLSAEFTEMIIAQRGFQANSRIITVSDTLLEELVNLKR